MTRSLYHRLGRPSLPADGERRTALTATVETLDNDKDATITLLADTDATRTYETKKQETVDNDGEVSLGYAGDGALFSPVRTRLTEARESVDPDPDMLALSHLA